MDRVRPRAYTCRFMRHVSPIIVVLLLGLAGCKHAEPTPEPAGVAASATPTSTSSAPSTQAPTPPAPSASAAKSPLPKVEKLDVKKCPARMAVVKHEGLVVELTGCPENVNGKGKAMLTLLDAKGAKKNEVELANGDAHSEELDVKDLYGTGKPVFFVTTAVPTMGSWGGPTTTIYEIENDRLAPVSVTNKDGKTQPLSLVSAIKSTWWLHPARSGKGQDIYVIKTSAEGKDTGYRFAYENGKWTARFTELKKWTGEILKDTMAEFP